MDYKHVPVLLSEALTALNIAPNNNYIDATLGGGGYTEAILEASKPKGKVLAIDLDNDAIVNFKTSKIYIHNSERCFLAKSNFSRVADIALKHDFTEIHGIVADLGLNSYLLESSGRGFSFHKRELLDMRFDTTSQTPTAAYLLNHSEDRVLLDWLENYGEERLAKPIVKEIIKQRSIDAFKTSEDLVLVIKKAIPKPIAHKWEDIARRVFQAIRIAVNNELNNLSEFLPKAFDLLAPKGRLVIVSFHSLEDRTVKRFFLQLSSGCVCPEEFPKCVCGKTPRGKILTKKPVTAQPEELTMNNRAKAAKLRAIEKY